MDIRDFFVKDFETTKKVEISDRFQDKEGNRIDFEIKPITHEENLEVLKLCKDKNGVLNEEKYKIMLVCKSVIAPNLKDTELQKFYNVLGEEKVIAKMLLAFEFEKLASEVYKASGFDFSLEQSVDHLKN